MTDIDALYIARAALANLGPANKSAATTIALGVIAKLTQEAKKLEDPDMRLIALYDVAVHSLPESTVGMEVSSATLPNKIRIVSIKMAIPEELIAEYGGV